MLSIPKPVVVVSRCLGFASCRYNGQSISDALVAKLAPFVEYKTVCPEVAIGLGVPRNPIRIISRGEELRLVQPATATDVTEEMRGFADRFLGSLGDDIEGFILKNRSPSCGLADVKVYTGVERSKSIARASGFFGGEVMGRFAGLAIEDEGRLKNQEIRDHFLTRLFALSRFRETKARHSMRQLVQFHAENKYLLMAHDEEGMRALGRIVANHDRLSVDRVLTEYESQLRLTLAHATKCGANINVLTHTIGFLKRVLSPDEKAFFHNTLETYRQGRIPLSVPIHMMRAYGVRFQEEYLLQQTFFAPFPEELVEITTTGKPPTCFAA